jgi:hypothetical protein
MNLSAWLINHGTTFLSNHKSATAGLLAAEIITWTAHLKKAINRLWNPLFSTCFWDAIAFLRCQLSWAGWSCTCTQKEKGTSACIRTLVVVSETLLHLRRLACVRSIQSGDAIRSQWLNRKRPSPPSPSPSSKNIFPCLGDWNRFSRFTAASSCLLLLTGPISISFSELNHGIPTPSVTNGVTTVGFVHCKGWSEFSASTDFARQVQMENGSQYQNRNSYGTQNHRVSFETLWCFSILFYFDFCYFLYKFVGFLYVWICFKIYTTTVYWADIFDHIKSINR